MSSLWSKLNMTFLHQRGLNDCKIAKLMLTPIVLLEPEYAKEIVECADKIGVAHYSPVFKNARRAIFLVSPARMDMKLDFLKKAGSWML
jgi:hypothetical protein